MSRTVKNDSVPQCFLRFTYVVCVEGGREHTKECSRIWWTSIHIQNGFWLLTEEQRGYIDNLLKHSLEHLLQYTSRKSQKLPTAVLFVIYEFRKCANKKNCNDYHLLLKILYTCGVKRPLQRKGSKGMLTTHVGQGGGWPHGRQFNISRDKSGRNNPPSILNWYSQIILS